MTTAWMMYALLVGGLLAAAARGLEGACRAAALPTRWVWAAALTLTLALVTLAPLRVQAVPAAALTEVVGTTVEAVVADPAAGRSVGELLRAARREMEAGLQAGLAAVERGVPEPLERGLALLWICGSLALLLGGAAIHHRFRRLRGHWPAGEVEGHRVRISPEAGPAVVGWIRPEIVVPRWLLQLGPEERSLVVAHEQEHVRARDPLLLALACVAAALLPWHPGVWWMLSRLRLAVEVDCDARVLRRGVEPGPYGSLLINLAGRCSGLRVGVPALADESSQLERRLLAMTTKRSRFQSIRGGSLAALALVALLVACEARLPTAAEVNQADAATAERAARRLSLAESGSTIYYVDGEQVSAEQAKALSSDAIARIEVSRTAGEGEGERSEIRMYTRAAAEATGEKRTSFSIKVEGKPGQTTAEETRIRVRGPGSHADMDRAMILIDGVRADAAALRALPQESIVTINVVKGEAATKMFPDADAANGVIQITTRAGAAKR